MHYFDFNATAPLHPAAREAWLEVQDRFWANPSSPTRFAAQAHHRLEESREIWAESLGVDPGRVVFTAGATVAMNAVFTHLAETSAPDARVLVSAIEHPSVREAATRWFPRRVDEIPAGQDGRIDTAVLEERLRANPYVAVAAMAANNETGVLQPVAEIHTLCREHRTRLVCDAAQWAGKLPLKTLQGMDYLTISGHKFGGSRGMGVIVLGAAEAAFRGPVGGGQENAHWAGTEDLAGIAAMTAAWQAQPVSGWSVAGREALAGAVRDRGYSVVGGETVRRLPNTLSLLLPAHPATRWIARLDRRGWMVSSGSACATGTKGPSTVLAAMGLAPEAAKRVLRISGGPASSVEEWSELAAALEAVRKELDDDLGEERLVTIVDL